MADVAVDEASAPVEAAAPPAVDTLPHPPTPAGPATATAATTSTSTSTSTTAATPSTPTYSGKGKSKVRRAERKGGLGPGKLMVSGKGKIHGAEGKKSVMSQSKRAGLYFPVGRMHRMMKEGLMHGKRVSGTAAIFLAAVLEYLCAEILELAGNVARIRHRVRITPRNLMIAIRGDPELDQFVKATIASGGVIPHPSIGKGKADPSATAAVAAAAAKNAPPSQKKKSDKKKKKKKE